MERILSTPTAAPIELIVILATNLALALSFSTYPSCSTLGTSILDGDRTSKSVAASCFTVQPEPAIYRLLVLAVLLRLSLQVSEGEWPASGSASVRGC